MMIFVECKADFALVKSITNIPKREIKHAGEKSGVLKRLERQRNCKGLVDEDPGSLQPPYMKKLKLEDNLSKHGIKLLYDNSNNNYLIVLCPRLEEWILRTAKKADIDVVKYGLPDKATKLHEEINADLSKFGRLIGDLQDSEGLKTLKKLLVGMENVNMDHLKA